MRSIHRNEVRDSLEMITYNSLVDDVRRILSYQTTIM
jgi:hypothetical protein